MDTSERIEQIRRAALHAVMTNDERIEDLRAAALAALTASDKPVCLQGEAGRRRFAQQQEALVARRRAPEPHEETRRPMEREHIERTTADSECQIACMARGKGCSGRDMLACDRGGSRSSNRAQGCPRRDGR